MKSNIIFMIILFIIAFVIFNAQKNNIVQTSPDLSKKNDIQTNENKSPKKLVVQNLQIRYKQLIAISLYGNLYLEDNKFRLTANSLFGKELDLGINDQELWYWSKRSKPKGIYYSNIENIDKTMLKAALSPSWLIKALGLSCHNDKNTKIIHNEKNDYIVNMEINHLKQSQTIVTIIEKNTNKILENCLYDDKGKIIAKASITQHQIIDEYTIPKKININWYEEGIQMEWTLNQTNISQKINKSVWIKPNIQPSFNIGK